MKRCLVGPAVVALSLALAPAAARAQDAKLVKKIEEINRAAIEDYDILEFESAKKQLSEALVLVKKNRLGKHQVAAKTHLSLGIVYGGGMSDLDGALVEFMSALEIDAGIALPPAYRNADLQKLFEQARVAVGVGGGRTGGDEAVGLKHAAVDEAKEGADIPITVMVGADVKAKQVILYYRSQGADGFAPVVMRGAEGAEHAGAIPAAATGGDSIHYYIEAKGAQGKVVAGVGSAGSPNIITVLRAPKEVADSDGSDSESPFAARASRGGGQPATDGGDTAVRSQRKSGGGGIFVSVLVGSGAGYVSGETEVSKQEVGCCVAAAPFHVMPEIGLRLAPQVVLSVVGRVGLPLGVDVPGAATAAPSGFLRLLYMLAPGGAGGYVHADVGGGYIRHTIPLTKTSGATVQGNVDTSVTGPLLLGTGAGWVKPLSESLRLLADASVTVGIPVVDEIEAGPGVTIRPGLAVNLDLSLGISMAF